MPKRKPAASENDCVRSSITLNEKPNGHFGGNHLALWGDNPALLTATGDLHADDASGVIDRTFWLKLRDNLTRVY